MRLLVTGAGRTGTWWLTHALRSCGVEAQHEVAFSTHRHGEGDWQCEVSWLAAPFTPVDAHVVHLVRHPLAAVASRAAWGSFEDHEPSRYDPRPKGRWALQHCPDILTGETPVERAAIHWVRWNGLVTADELLRIEDVTAATVQRLARLVDPNSDPPTLPPRSNQSKRPPKLTWADIDTPGLRALAEEYGYR